MVAPPVERQVAVLGLGYVGLPLAVALTRVAGSVVGYDVNAARVNQLRTRGDPEVVATADHQAFTRRGAGRR